MDPNTLVYTEITSLAYYIERCHTEICTPCKHKPRERLPSVFRVNKLTPLVFCKTHLIRIRQLIGMRWVSRVHHSPRYPIDLVPDRDEIVEFLASTPPAWFRSNSNFTFPYKVPPTFSQRLTVLLGWDESGDPGIGPSTMCPSNPSGSSINSFHMAAVLGWNGSVHLGCKLTEAEKVQKQEEQLAQGKVKTARRFMAAELSKRTRSGAVRRTVRTMKTKQLRSLKAQRKTAEVLKRLERPERPQGLGEVEWVVID
ncbi:hypothetical protein B0J13DRAFT_180418 [Dactylonectria estremocensis]|uniref:Uncharacterized protein n=1 Tax=Dactylonectria estremocensis TaxID=1079267 RepID=A0A9P9FBP6_9HYPO|nr:hypothetical protein B0J13DRAFT_180418 [Dactylonectria estremocensis]